MRTPHFVRPDRMAMAVLIAALAAVPASAHVILDAPNGGEQLEEGSAFTVTWHILIAHDLQNWDLWYSTEGANGPWISIAQNLPAGSGQAGSVHTYDWTVPDAADDTVWVRVRMDNSGADYYDVSNAPFSIMLPPTTKQVIVGPGGARVFSPENLEIDIGDTVRWIWDATGHNVVSGVPGMPDGAFFSGDPAPAGTVYEVVFDQAFLDANLQPDGVYDYYCEPHAGFGMLGTVEMSLPCPADFDNDGTVGAGDLAQLLGNWGPCADCGDCPGELEGNCHIGPTDLAGLLGTWGLCP